MATDTDDPGTGDECIQELTFIDTEPETTCRICHAEFLDSEDLNVHIDQVHREPSEPDTSGSKVCQLCDTTYRDLDVYAHHIAYKHLRQLVACKTCNKCFTEEIKLKKHDRKHEIQKSSLFACSQCKAVFSIQKELAAHEYTYHNNLIDGFYLTCLPHVSLFLKLNALEFLQSKDRVLNCVSCKFGPVNIKSYLKHVKNKECKAYVCDICCYAFCEKKYLTKHLQRKNKCKYPHEYETEMTTCALCKTKIHCKEMNTHRSMCRMYKCYVCDIQFKTIESLSEHQSNVHPVELDIIRCKFCPKEYVGQVSLDKHVKRSHSHQFILYKYACKLCGHIFKHPQELFVHYFMKHKDLEPYTCKICDKKFKIRKRFTIHIKMEHKGIGVVEFDENYNVFFADKKSESPFIPKCVIPELVPVESEDKTKTKSSRSKKDDFTTEIDETEVEDIKELPKHKPKTKGLKRKRRNIVALSSSEEEESESLLMIKKRAQRKNFQKKFASGSKKLSKHMIQRKQFTCKHCNKYCYTYQNYHNHIKTHKKNESIECIKCLKSFKTKAELNTHVTNTHSTSKLIETLKNVLERKQVETQGLNNDSDNNVNFDDLTPSERFVRTIKKVRVDKQSVSAIIGPTSGEISVKNFIENFVPDVGEVPKDKEPQIMFDEPVVSVKQYESPFYRKNSIKMTRFVPEPPITSRIKLKMPEKFKAQSHNKEVVKLTVKLVPEPLKMSNFLTFENNDFTDHQDNTDHHDYEDNDYDDRNDVIPDVAQEVMLGESEESSKPHLQAPHKIVIPKLPAGYPKIHIATLQPQAPFFKIITVKNSENADEAIVIDPQKHKTAKELKTEKNTHAKIKSEVISLPDGTKLVSANPLAHLLGDRPVEEILQPIKKNYYKPVEKNIRGLLADALQNLDKNEHRIRKPKKTSVPKKAQPRKNKLRKSELKKFALNYHSEKLKPRKSESKELVTDDSEKPKTPISEPNNYEEVLEDSELVITEPGKSLPLL